jgi:diguanylate cyclase (GGDEF)-like protein
MESLWEWLVDESEGELGCATGDATLLGALFEATEGALVTSPLRLFVTVSGCQADPSSVPIERVERLALSSTAASVLACAATCGPLRQPGPDDRFDTTVISTLHQINPGPFLVALDRRSGFGITIAARRRHPPQLAESSALYDIVWSLSADVAMAVMRRLSVHVQGLGVERQPRALPTAETAVSAPAPAARPRSRSRAKPGSGGAWRGSPEEVLAGRETALALAGRLLVQLQTALAFEGALLALAAKLESAREIDDVLDMIASSLGLTLEASRVTAHYNTPGGTDELPTVKLDGVAPFKEAREGIYTRVDTRRLDSTRSDRADSGTMVSRLVMPILRAGVAIGEVRLLDTRPARVWSAMEQRFVERAVAFAAEALSRPFAAPDAESDEEAPSTDKLTGLELRSAFDRRLRTALDEAERAGEPVSLVRLKINELEDINESYGFPAGNAVIRRVAGLLRERLAEDEGSSLARFGGEEFAILLPGFTRLAALRVATILVDAVSNSKVPPVGEIVARAGVATFPDCAATADQLAAVARSRMVGT